MLVTTLQTMQMWGDIASCPVCWGVGAGWMGGSWASLPLQRPAQEEELSHMIDV